MKSLLEMGKAAKEAAFILAGLSSETKNRLIKSIAATVREHQKKIETVNRSDVKDSERGGMSPSMIDRLVLEGRLEGIAADVEKVATLQDPVGERFDVSILENGLELEKVRTPIGVIGVIYEARPNVTLDIAALALKTGNAVILRGGSETLRTNKLLVQLVQEALKKENLPVDAVQLIESRNRKYVKELLHLQDYVDMIIPRGGAGLHQFCRDNSTIPVITGGIGICHLFVDETANIDKSVEVIYNAKTQRPTVCNALDTLLVHRNIAAAIIPKVIARLEPGHVIFKADKEALKLTGIRPSVSLAEESDWKTEWLSLVLGIKVVNGLDDALEHIQHHSTGHSDGILTEYAPNAERFVRAVDSAAVYVNASTRFTDGGQFGLGAEVAISTQKLHARGPMGLKELTTYKWVVRGNYQTRK